VEEEHDQPKAEELTKIISKRKVSKSKSIKKNRVLERELILVLMDTASNNELEHFHDQLQPLTISLFAMEKLVLGTFSEALILHFLRKILQKIHHWKKMEKSTL
jgi:hypothetical protein